MGPPEKLQGRVGGAIGLDAPKGQSGDSMTEITQSRPERFFSDRFNVTPNLMERLLGSNLAGKVDDADWQLLERNLGLFRQFDFSVRRRFAPNIVFEPLAVLDPPDERLCRRGRFPARDECSPSATSSTSLPGTTGSSWATSPASCSTGRA